MQLDKTSIVIAQRSGLDLIDLSLMVLRRYWKPLLVLAVLGSLPFAIIDFVLTYPLQQYDNIAIQSRDFSSTALYRGRYLVVITMLIYLQAPLALSLMTYYLGQAVFSDAPSFQRTWAMVKERGWALFYVHGLLRCALLGWLPAAAMFWNPVPQWELEIFVYGFCMLGWVMAVRSARPFASEILLLERCPIWGGTKGKQMTYGARSNWLHTGLSGDLIVMNLGMAMVSLMTILALTFGVLFTIGVLSGIWTWGVWMDQILYPLILWAVATWSGVIRFLNYMNSRIRTEGWELELRLKAEAARLEGVPI